jgi:hypothetical protein
MQSIWRTLAVLHVTAIVPFRLMLKGKSDCSAIGPLRQGLPIPTGPCVALPESSMGVEVRTFVPWQCPRPSRTQSMPPA